MQECDTLIAKDPNDPDLLINRGNGWLRKKEFDKAEADFQQAIAIKPDYFRSHAAMGTLWERRGNNDAAEAAFSEAIKLNPNDANAYANRGLVLNRKQAFDKAIADFDAAIRLAPKNVAAYQNRGLAYSRKGDNDKAIADFDRVIALDPKHASAYHNRGFRFNIRGEHEKAISDYDQAIKLNPKDAAVYASRGTSWLKKADLDKAVADFSEAVRLNPNDSLAYGNRGLAWNGKGDYDRAISDFDEAIRLRPDNAISFRGRGYSWLQKNEDDKAIADNSEAIRLDPNSNLAYANRGLAYSRQGDYDKALSDYDQAIKLTPDRSSYFNSRGNVWSRKKEFDKAITDYNQAIRLDPSNDLAKNNLQLALERKQRLKGASALPAAKSAGRVALVIGNSKYTHASALKNPAQDAQLFAATLRGIGFQTVTVRTDLTRDGMIQALKEFDTLSKTAEWAVIYYAGHGIEVDGVNYMIPVNAQLNDLRNVAREAVHLGQALNSVELAKKLRLVILDACRDNPFASQMRKAENTRSVGELGTTSIGKGLARIEPDAGTLVVYAAKHGEFALDGNGKNSPFVEAVIKRINQKPALEVRRLFDFVREDVLQSTKKAQQPFSYGSLSAREDFFFLK